MRSPGPPTRPPRRRRLLAAAAELFARWGFDKTSLDEVARAAGVSKGAIYLEFPNKDALFKAVVYRELAHYTRDWLQRFERDDDPFSFVRMFQHSIAAINANPFVKGLMTRDQRIYGSFLQRESELFAMAISLRAELFGRLQELGAMRDDIPAATLAYLISVIGHGLVAGAEAIPERQRVPFEDSLRALGLLLDRGLAPPRPRNRKAVRELLLAMVAQAQAALESHE